MNNRVAARGPCRCQRTGGPSSLRGPPFNTALENPREGSYFSFSHEYYFYMLKVEALFFLQLISSTSPAMHATATRLTSGAPLLRAVASCVRIDGPPLHSFLPQMTPVGCCVAWGASFVPSSPRPFSTGGPKREAYVSFGYKTVPVEEKEKLVGGIFTSVAGEEAHLGEGHSVG